MRVDSLQGVMPSRAQSANNEDQADDFGAVLRSAKQNVAQPQSNDGKSPKSTPSVSAKTAAQELEEFLRKSPIQHMRDAILKEMGLTEEDLKNMPPDKRAAIEDAIADRIKKKLLGEHRDDVFSSGVSRNISATGVAGTAGVASLPSFISGMAKPA